MRRERALTLVAVVAMALGAMAGLSAQTTTQPAVPRPPRYVTREQWGSKPEVIPDSRKHTPAWITIHHAGELWTNDKDPVKFVQNMQAWGKRRPQVEKPPRNTYWPDLPYHFLIAPDGRIFEGRPVAYEPESNTKMSLAGNIAIELMGNFEAQRPSVAQLQSVTRLTAWLMQQHHLDLDHVRTHRDAAPGQTVCPGRDFYRYIEDGKFKQWVKTVLAGEKLKIEPGPPLKDGPTTLITETKATTEK
jgi:hypothetical protein